MFDTVGHDEFFSILLFDHVHKLNDECGECVLNAKCSPEKRVIVEALHDARQIYVEALQ